MSLINDALKRARDSQQKNPPPAAPPLPPVECREREFNWILPAMVILLIVVACFFLGLAMSKHTFESTVTAPTAPAPEVAASETPATPPVETQQMETASAPIPPTPNNVDVVVPAPIPSIKVQGIMYDPVRSWAIVDGKTVYVGDRVHDFRVKAISKNAITLTGPGGTNEVLWLGD